MLEVVEPRPLLPEEDDEDEEPPFEPDELDEDDEEPDEDEPEEEDEPPLPPPPPPLRFSSEGKCGTVKMLERLSRSESEFVSGIAADWTVVVTPIRHSSDVETFIVARCWVCLGVWGIG